ncbi:MAG: hypothetical protein HPAVJP_1400 [Candidatus Hepatoplasma vulgare]|nr:MAG: hypothetical protein HPAVJP_1400 [Candidatus Hepatoplasma sp.]
MNSNVFKHRIIEKKWQKYWKKNNLFKTNLKSKKEKFYVLDMFPYPSGSGLHVGHPEGYTATDIIARMKRMQGYEVLHPIGWDAFGLPAEQYAIKTGNDPKSFTKKNISNFKKQLVSLGFSFDWSREVNTSDPKYYKWTQWIFAKLYREGLVELKDIEINWSESLNTVLANEEIIKNENGEDVAERDGLPVFKKNMKQWVILITKYADKLFEGLDDLDWPDSLKKIQKNWIYEKDENGKNKLHLKDWIFARQRYWGEPFPLIHFDDGEIYLIPERKYPVLLPKIKNYKFSLDGKPALSKAIKWSNVKIKGRHGIRDLNTMPQWAGSCWYFIAYLLKNNNNYLALDSSKAKSILDKWLPIDLYIGGREHATSHLIYARFWTMFLSDINITKINEPFKRIFNQGMILGEDNQKMSKSKGNVINPNFYIEKYGADTLRLYEMFMGPLEDVKSWSNKSIHGMHIWVERVYKFFIGEAIYIKDEEVSFENKKAFNKLLEKINNHFPKLKFNVSVSEMMIFINTVYKNPRISKEMAIKFLQILSCFAPHISDEIYSKIKRQQKSISFVSWPIKYELKKEEELKTILLQINGKVRATFQVKFSFDLENLKQKEILKLICKYAPKYCTDKSKLKNIFIIKNRIISITV